MTSASGSNDSLRREIAAGAARIVADSGLDYASAKAKAARQVLGEGRAPRGALPDNDEIDEALLEHLELFDEEHAERLARMRRTALALMERLAEFRPHATGAVWKGIATEHVPIHLQVFHDNPKEVAFRLLDEGIAFDSTTVPHFRGAGGTGGRDPEVEAMTFHWRGEPVLLSVYSLDDLRGALRAADGKPLRGDRQALAARAAAEA